jgi:kynurenine formamidase
MLIDITYSVTKKDAENALKREKQALFGHIGTHFDCMDREFPLEYTKRRGVVFDVTCRKEEDISESDIDLSLVEKDMFAAFYTGYIEKEGYGTKSYFTEHPQIKTELIEKLIQKGVSLIGIDFTGMRRGEEHIKWDMLSAQKGVFVIENLYGLNKLLGGGRSAFFTAHTYPVKYEGMTGLPCRVVAEI